MYQDGDRGGGIGENKLTVIIKSRNSKYYILSQMLQSLCQRVSPCGCYLGRFVRTDACVSPPNKQVQGRGSHKLAAGHWAGESTNILLTMCPGGSRSTVGTLVNTAGIKLELQENHQHAKFSQSQRKTPLGPSPG